MRWLSDKATEKVLAKLNAKRGGVTFDDFAHGFGLGARIFDLRDAGASPVRRHESFDTMLGVANLNEKVIQMEPSPYDQRALTEIHAWKNPDIGWFDHAMTVINWPLNKAGDLILSTPGIGDAIKRSIQGITFVCNDAAQWSISQKAIYGEFHKAGHSNVHGPADVFGVDLEQIDKLVGWLDAKYKGIALVEGAGLGAIGLPGIPPDVAAVITLALRAVGEYATYYGFDVSLQNERLFALNILGLASSGTAQCKALAMAQLVKIAQDTAKKKAWKVLEQHAFVQVIQQISGSSGNCVP